MTTPAQHLTMQDPEHGTLLSMPAVLLLAAGAAFGDDSTLAGRTKGKILVRRILSAARAGGFTKSEVLETLLSRLETSPRVKQLAIEAVEAAGHDVVLEIISTTMAKHP